MKGTVSNVCNDHKMKHSHYIFKSGDRPNSERELNCLLNGYFMNLNQKFRSLKPLLSYFPTLQFPSENFLCTKMSSSAHQLFPNLKLILNLNLFVLSLYLFFYPEQRFDNEGQEWLTIILQGIWRGRRWLWDCKFFHSGGHPCFENPSCQTSTRIWICR